MSYHFPSSAEEERNIDVIFKIYNIKLKRKKIMSNITNIAIQDTKSAGPHSVPGWSFIPTDLNKGAGGDYIYLGYKRGSGTPVSNITFAAYDESQKGNPKPDWNWNPIDLNRGAGGKYIYVFWKQDQKATPIVGLMVLATDNAQPIKIGGWTAIDQDLNQGAGGKYIWCYYSTIVEFGS